MGDKKVKWKLKPGATWRQKLERSHPSHGKVVAIPARMWKTCGRGTMVIPRPMDVDGLMRRVRKGHLITRSQLRAALARKAGADAACPLTTGIFVRIVAEAAEEDRRAGRKTITPYWRTVKHDGSLNDRFPGGATAQGELLRQEGFTILAARGRLRVAEFEKYLA
jgi:hypothetical protein